MTKKSDLPDLVESFLDKSPCVKRDMSRGLINMRALARYIIKVTKTNASIDAVMSAIRRYEVRKYDDLFVKARKVLLKSKSISTRSNLCNVSLVKNTECQNSLPKLFSIIHYNHGDILRIIHANESIKVLVDEKNLEAVLKIFSENEIIEIDKNLAEINVHQHQDAKYTPGVIAATSNELAINGINILETTSCFPEWLWIVDEKDLIKAYAVVSKVWRG